MARSPLPFAWLAALVLLAPPAGATSLGFRCITGNRAADCAAGVAQIRLEVSPGADGVVVFAFRNAGVAASSITDVYFDGDALLALAAITNAAGVSFAPFATPAELPGARDASPRFVSDPGLSAGSRPAVQPNGVNPGEVLALAFRLSGAHRYEDVLADLASGRLRVGVHVQGFASGGSESFVCKPLPEPSGLALVGLALAAGAALRARRR